MMRFWSNFARHPLAIHGDRSRERLGGATLFTLQTLLGEGREVRLGKATRRQPRHKTSPTLKLNLTPQGAAPHVTRQRHDPEGSHHVVFVAICLAVLCGHRLAVAQDFPVDASENASAIEGTEKTLQGLPPLDKDWVRITEGKNKVWINRKQKQVAVDGEVCLTKGYLEMFACILGTKEHESVVALHSQAFVIHTGLLAVGAVPGSPAQWRPNYRPATGTKVHLELEWVGNDGELQKAKAQDWIRDLKTKKAMAHDWVFAGSLFWVDPETKKKFYRAEGGEIVCVSNFPVAMLDLPIESSQTNDELSFEAFTENIPPRRTPVRLYFRPEIPKKELDRKPPAP